MKINIITNTQSYIPEAFAYDNYFKLNGLNSDLIDVNDIISNDTDLIIKFMGFEPFYTKSHINKNVVKIHEYTSLSTPPYAYFKDKIKFIFNSKPDGRIFLNSLIKYYFGFSDDKKSIYRDMGIDKPFFDIKKNNNNLDKDYDLVYCGSINQRSGLIDCIINLLKLDFKILLIGSISDDLYHLLSPYKSIEMTGKIDRLEIPNLYARAYCGLNFTPNQYPFNFQTSTKTLEYCAANLGVLSSKYFWSENFAKSRYGKFLWLEDLKSKKQFEDFKFVIPDVLDLEWTSLLDDINFIKFIKSFIR